MIKERRKHARLRIPLEAEYQIAGEEDWRQGTIWTLGAGGAALLCDRKLDVGTELSGLHFVVEAETDQPEARIEVGAEVVNVDREGDFGCRSCFMLGLQFVGLGEQDFELLRQFVFRRLTGAQSSPAPSESSAAADTPPIEIRFKLFDEFVDEVSESLSPTGMFIRAHRPQPPGSRFAFQYQLGDDFSLFQGTAEVVWTRRRSEGPERPPGMGVRFLELDPSSQRMVRRLVGQRDAQAASGPADRTAEPRPPEDAKAEAETEKAEEPAAPPPQEDEPAAASSSAGEPGATAETPPAGAEAAVELESIEESPDDGAQTAAIEESPDDGAQTAAIEESPDDGAEAAAGEASPDDAAEAAAGEASPTGLDRLAERLSAAEAAGDEARERLTRLAVEADGVRRELGDERTARSAAEDAREAAETAAKQLRAEMEEAAGRAADELVRRQAEWGALESDLRERLDRSDARHDDVERLTARAEDAENELERLRQEASEARREAQSVEAELRAQLERQSAERADLEDRLTQADGAATELRRRVAELEEQVARDAKIEAALREQAQELRAAPAELEARLERASGRLRRLREASAALRSGLGDELDAAVALDGELAQRLSEVAAAGAELDEKVDGLGAARSGLGERLTRLAGAWSELEHGLAEADERDLAAEQTADAEPPAAKPPAGAAPPDEAGAARERLDGAVVPASQPGHLPDAAPAEAPPAQAAAAESPPSESPSSESPSSESPPSESPPSESPPAEPPAPTPVEAETEAAQRSAAARLVGVARRAAARLGLARDSAGDGDGSSSRRDPSGDAPGRDPSGDAPGCDPSGDAAGPDPSGDAPGRDAEASGSNGGNGAAAIEETVRAWAAAWSEQRVEDYLSFYSREFRPVEPAGDEAGEPPHAWLPPLAGMELTLGPISHTELSPGRRAVHFEQRVASDSYARCTGRTLELVRESDAWKIAAESFQEL